MLLDKPTLQALLNLPGVDVEDYHITPDSLTLQVEYHSATATCPRCGTLSSHLHQNHFNQIRDLPIVNRPVVLKVNRRQFKCKTCKKPFSESLDFVHTSRRYTHRFERQIVQRLIDSDIHNVAQEAGLSDDQVLSILKHVAQIDIQPDLSNLRRLGIDEISLRKGHQQYIVILVDLEHNRPLGFVASRKQEALEEVFSTWPKAVLEGIEEVSMDMSYNYKSVVNRFMSNAVVTVDRFHVMKQVNDELDQARRDEQKELKKNKSTSDRTKQEVIKKSKYVLLKNEDTLSEKGREKLEVIKQELKRLGGMHKRKEEFRDIFEEALHLGEGILRLLDWLKRAESDYPESVGTIKRWFGEVIGYFERGTTNGAVEGINNKLKLIKRRGFGFTNIKNFEQRCLICWYFSPSTA